MRLSSNNDSCFTISRINKDNKIVHQRIARDKRGNYVVQVGEELKAFKSLIDLIEKGEKDLNLKVVSPLPPLTHSYHTVNHCAACMCRKQGIQHHLCPTN